MKKFIFLALNSVTINLLQNKQYITTYTQIIVTEKSRDVLVIEALNRGDTRADDSDLRSVVRC